jgi:transcriptional regulator with AAA-type ATPase domain
MILKPLRERKEDIPPLIVYWLEMAFREHQANQVLKGEQKEASQPLRKVHIEDIALQFFLGYHYPANIRSLFDLLDEITATAGTFDEMRRSDFHDEITLDFDQIPAEYMTDEFHALKKKDDEEKVRLTFIPESSEPESSEPESSEPESSEESGFQGKLDHLKEELNQLGQRHDPVSKGEVQPIIEETGFKSQIEGFKSMTAEEKSKLKGAFKAIASCAKMTNDEKRSLLTEEGSVWKELTHGEIAFLFGCVEATVSRWRKRGGG